MKVELRVEGGFGFFPGLAAPFVLDTDGLPQEEARRLTELLERARVFDRPVVAEPRGRRADVRCYRLTVDGPAGPRTLVLHDPLEPELAAVVEFVRARQREARQG